MASREVLQPRMHYSVVSLMTDKWIETQAQQSVEEFCASATSTLLNGRRELKTCLLQFTSKKEVLQEIQSTLPVGVKFPFPPECVVCTLKDRELGKYAVRYHEYNCFGYLKVFVESYTRVNGVDLSRALECCLALSRSVVEQYKVDFEGAVTYYAYKKRVEQHMNKTPTKAPRKRKPEVARQRNKSVPPKKRLRYRGNI